MCCASRFEWREGAHPAPEDIGGRRGLVGASQCFVMVETNKLSRWSEIGAIMGACVSARVNGLGPENERADGEQSVAGGRIFKGASLYDAPPKIPTSPTAKTGWCRETRDTAQCDWGFFCDFHPFRGHFLAMRPFAHFEAK